MIHFSAAYHQKQKKKQKNQSSEAMDHFGCFHLIDAESINATACAANWTLNEGIYLWFDQ